MNRVQTESLLHSFLYGGASVLLALDVFFLIKALFQQNFVPIVPVIAGVFLAGGLLLVIYAEQHIRAEEKKEHRRLSRVATQLESPLGSLQEDLQYLSDNAQQLPAEMRMKLKHMETKSAVLLENVRDVFLMLRAQEGNISQTARMYDACTLLKESVARAKKIAGAHNSEILMKAHCYDAPVKVDRHLFFIALGHVLENAVLYSLRPGIVNVAITRGQSQMRIFIQDRGIGVKEQDKDVIFRPFARGDKAGQFDPDGIGVGLTLARLIIKEFGGSLTWKNRTDSTGSIFEIALPLVKK